MKSNLFNTKSIKTILWILMGFTIFSACSKEYSIEGGFSKMPVGSWEFKDSIHFYTGNMDTAYIVSGQTQQELHLLGTNMDGSQQFDMVLYADSITKGTYKASLFQVTFDFTSGSESIFEASQLIGEFSVTITSISDKIVLGTFLGVAQDSAKQVRSLFDGKFKTTLSSTPVQGPVSSGVLGDDQGNCTPATIEGNYKQGTPMNPDNLAQVQVTISEAGSYHIFTDAVNGITFSASGVFTTTGPQNVTLEASGTPAFSGDQQFIVHYGNNQCAFTINFLPGAAPSGDYYPTTVNTNWTFSDFTGSQYFKVVSGAKTVSGTPFSIIGNFSSPQATTFDTARLIAKGNGNYFEYINYNDYFPMDEETSAATIILKDNVAQGTTWNGPTISGTVSGTDFSYYARFTILEKAVAVNLGGFSFPDVIKVKVELFSGSTSLTMSAESWYAKNVGPIYEKSFSGNINEITNYQIF